MSDPNPKAIRIPNPLLAAAAIVFMGAGIVALVSGDRSLAISTFAGAGISLSLLNFSYPALRPAMKLLVTPLLLLPFAAMAAVMLDLV